MREVAMELKNLFNIDYTLDDNIMKFKMKNI